MDEQKLIEVIDSIIKSRKNFYVGNASQIDIDGFVSLNGIKAQVVGTSLGADVVLRDGESGVWVAFVRGFSQLTTNTRLINLSKRDPSKNPIPEIWIGITEQSGATSPTFIEYLDLWEGQFLYGEYPPYYQEVGGWLLNVPSDRDVTEILAPFGSGFNTGDAYKSLILGLDQAAGLITSSIKKLPPVNEGMTPPKSPLIALKIEDLPSVGKLALYFSKNKERAKDTDFGYQGLSKGFGIGISTQQKRAYREVQQFYLHRFFLKDNLSAPYIDYLTDYPINQNIFNTYPAATFVESFGEGHPTITSLTATTITQYEDDVLKREFPVGGRRLSVREWEVKMKWKTDITQSDKETVPLPVPPRSTSNTLTITRYDNPWAVPLEAGKVRESIHLDNGGTLIQKISPFARTTGSQPTNRYRIGIKYYWQSSTETSSTNLFFADEITGASSSSISFSVSTTPVDAEMENETLTVTYLSGTVHEATSPLKKPIGELTYLVAEWVVQAWWVATWLETPVQWFHITALSSETDDEWVNWVSYRTVKIPISGTSLYEEYVEFYSETADPCPWRAINSSSRNLSSPFYVKEGSTNLYLSIRSVDFAGAGLVDYPSVKCPFTGFYAGQSLENFHYPPRYGFFVLKHSWNSSEVSSVYSYHKFLFQGRLILESRKTKTTKEMTLLLVNRGTPFAGFTSFDHPSPGDLFWTGNLIIPRFLIYDNATSELYIAETDTSSASTFTRVIKNPVKYCLGIVGDFIGIRTSSGGTPFTLPRTYYVNTSYSPGQSLMRDTPDILTNYVYSYTLSLPTQNTEGVREFLYEEVFTIKDKSGSILLTIESPYYCIGVATSGFDPAGKYATISAYHPSSGTAKFSRLYTSSIASFLQEGGYEYLTEEKYNKTTLQSMITLPNEVTSFQLNKKPSDPTTNSLHGLIHLPEGGSYSVALNVSTELTGTAVIKSNGTVNFKGHDFSAYLAPLRSQDIPPNTKPGYIEYTEGQILDNNTGVTYPCFTVSFGENNISGDTSPVSFQVTFIDRLDSTLDVRYRYRKDKFYESYSTAVETDSFPSGEIKKYAWVASDGFRYKPDYTVDGGFTSGYPAAGVNITGEITQSSIIISGSSDTNFGTIIDRNMGAVKGGDYIFSIQEDGTVTGIDNFWLFEDGNTTAPIKRVPAPFSLPSSFYLILKVEEVEVIEGGNPKTKAKVTVYACQSLPESGNRKSWLVPLFSSIVKSADPLGGTYLMDKGQVIKKLLG